MRLHALAMTLLLIAASSNSQSAEPILSSSGFGPIRFGMSTEEASKKLGIPLVRVKASDQGDRYRVVPSSGYAGIVFSVSASGIIDGAIIHYNARRFKTDRHLAIGSSSNDIWKKYGASVDAKTYRCGSDFLIFTFREVDDPTHGIIYTISNSGLVEMIRAGDIESEIPPC